MSIPRSADFINKWPVRVMPESELAARPFQMTALETSDGESGLAVWSTIGDTQSGTVLAFPWFTMMPGIVAVGDTMEVMTNVILLDATGNPLTPESRLRAIFQVLWDLKWYEAVAARLKNKNFKRAPRSVACAKAAPARRTSIRLTASN